MSNQEDIAIKVEGVYKDFDLPHEAQNSLKTRILHPMSKGKNIERQHALKDISFEIKKGEFFGIVGRNGSGKSTLLKILAEIYTPTKGKVTVNGSLTPFIELGVGFNPELTGRENVYLNGAMLGFSAKEMEAMYDKIVDFAELEKFMDQKLKNYSSGMQVRLAFSVAIRAKSDILLLDEVLAVGDADFQQKCFDYFKTLKKDHKTVVLVSHDMNAIKQFCNKALLIKEGRVGISGNTEEIARAYSELFVDKTQKMSDPKNSRRWGEQPTILNKCSINISRNEISIKGELSSNRNLTAPILGFVIKNYQGINIVGSNSKILNVTINDITNKTQRFSIIIPNIFSSGIHLVDLALLKEDGIGILDWWSDALEFKIHKEEQSPYLTNPSIKLLFK